MIKKLGIYILITIILSYLIRDLIYVGIRKNTMGEYDKLNTIFQKQNHYDMLFMGSSRAESHFNPQIIDSIIHTDSYNIGLAGITTPLALACLESYLIHSSMPKYVVLNIDFHSFTGNEDTIYRFPKYFPYLSNNLLYEKLKEKDKRFYWFKWIPFYSMPFFSDKYLDASFRGYLGLRNESDKLYVKGYVPVSYEYAKDADTLGYYYYDHMLMPKEEVFQSIDSIIGVCRKNAIQLVWVISPVYHKLTESVINRNELLHRLKEVAKSNNIVLFDYTYDSLCYNKYLFNDPGHLNEKGSRSFSVKFAQDFCNISKKQSF